MRKRLCKEQTSNSFFRNTAFRNEKSATLQKKEENGDRTVMACSNTTGEHKLKVIVIGR